MPLSSLASWKDYFSSNKSLDSSNNHLVHIRNSVGPSIPFKTSFEEISKNKGISFLSLDPTESHMQLFHHGAIIGGSWASPSTQLISILGFDHNAKPIQIVQKSIKDVKVKANSYEDFTTGLETIESFEKLKNPKLDFHYKNIVPIPQLLTKTFMNLPNTDPYTVAKAFFEQMHHFDAQINAQPINDPQSEPDLEAESVSDTDSLNEDHEVVIQESTIPTTKNASPEFMKDFFHVIQFCHLCAKGKIPPVLYSLSSTPETQNWISALKMECLPIPRSGPKRSSSTDSVDSDGDNVSSPEQKLSRKDHYFIHTMMKLHDTMDKNNLKQTLEKDEKEAGFPRLESHRKNLILNASALPPFDVQMTQPTEFHTTFLSKKSQFKAKEMMLHRFHLDKVAFNPSTSFIANLWNGDFFLDITRLTFGSEYLLLSGNEITQCI
jgi:hypothetical protein